MPATVVNMIAGPGAGKSTTAAGVFFLLKCAGVKCELVSEFAKELSYDQNWTDLKRQLFVLTEQERRQRRLVDQTDIIITDAPILTGVAYTSDPRDFAAIDSAARALWETYDNVNFVIRAVKPYQTYGRNQTEAQARAIDTKLMEIYKNEVIEAVIDGDFEAPWKVLQSLVQLGLVDADSVPRL